LRVDLNQKDEALQINTDLLNEARTKATKIIDDANNRALDIVSKTTLLADASAENFRQEISRNFSAQIEEFEKTTANFTKIYSQALQDLKIKNIEVFQNVSKDIETNTMIEVKDFKESMQKLTILSQKEIQKKMETDYESSKKEIEDYRKEEMEKLNSGVYEVLEKTAKLVLGKAINLSDHEELITKSLEKAKKQGIFR
jgi:F0F1-type ATP synthase membrane subunit b/b'